MNKVEWAVGIHGGAGALSRDRYSDKEIADATDLLESNLNVARDMLQAGKSAMDVAVELVRRFEDHYMYNAGRGSVLNAEGVCEMDASVMDGKTGWGAGLSCLTKVKHPILGARALCDTKNHALLAGEGAEDFCKYARLEFCDPDYFVTPIRKEQHEKFIKTRKMTLDHGNTVGAVVMDTHGNLAAATSTGGMNGKAKGRVSDTSIIGAGTWADNNTLAISGTGTGDYFIRLSLCRMVHDLMFYRNLSLEEACDKALHELLNAGGNGGFAAVDRHGNIALPFNSGGMFRGGLNSLNERICAIWD